jgi:predicted TPR repeat methyltransferase
MSQENFSIQFPETSETMRQDEEYIIVKYEGEQQRLRCHDYDKIYSIPGLYEQLFYEKLQCQSPQTVCSLLEQEVEQSPTDVSDLTVLDVGAGNGMVGEQLVNIGVDSVVGLDIVEEAAEATERDRPGVYEEYYVADLTDLPDTVEQELEEQPFNCLTTVATLGFGDIPPLAFAEAYNFITTPGWIAFNIKDKFLRQEDSTGFADLIKQMIASDTLQVQAQQRYRHRLSLAGDPLYYVAIVGQKTQDISLEVLEGM